MTVAAMEVQQEASDDAGAFHAGAALAAAGYVPLVLDGKKPTRGKWSTADADTLRTEARRAHASRNFGVRCGDPASDGFEIGALDFDVDDQPTADLIAEVLVMRSAPVRFGRPSRVLVPVQVPAGTAKSKTFFTHCETGAVKGVEVLAKGQQFAGFGVHPDTGRPYSWPSGSILDVAPADLFRARKPRAIIEQLMRAANWREATPGEVEAARKGEREGRKADRAADGSSTAAPVTPLPVTPRYLAAVPRRMNAEVDAGDVVTDATIEDLRSALTVLDADDYDTWIQVGHELKTLPDDAGYGLWIEWSQRSDRFDGAQASAKWESFEPTSTHWRAVFTAAFAAGWTNPASKTGRAAEAGETPAWVEELNAAYALDEETRSIYRIEQGDRCSAADLRLLLDTQLVQVGSGDRPKFVGAGSGWLRSPGRRQHRGVRTRPGEPEITGDGFLNDFRGMAIAPCPAPVSDADIAPFLAVHGHVYGTETGWMMYPLQWASHLLRYPGLKMHVALALWSMAQGVGKNLWAECLMRIIGERHAALIDHATLHSQFNGWVNRRIFVIGDEVSNTDRRADADKIKGLITSSTIYVNEKFQPARAIENKMNMMFLSNRPDTVYLDNMDRWFFVHEAEAGPLPPKLIREFVVWRNNGGLAKLHRWLLDLSLEGFDPQGRAPVTASKRAMVEANRSDLERWLAELLESDVREVLGREVATLAELAGRYRSELRLVAPPSSRAVAHALVRLGLRTRDSQVRVPGGHKIRMVALANADRWRGMPESAWAEEYARKKFI